MNYIHYIIVTVAFLLVGGTNADAQTDRNSWFSAREVMGWPM